jgi:Flp pilus assembly protein TadD
MVKKLRGPMPPHHWRSIPGGTGTKQRVADLLQRAQAHFQAAAYQEARETSRRVLEVDSNNADAYHLLGAIAFQEQDFAEAETLFTEAIGRNRRSPHLRHLLGEVQRALGKHESAAAAYRQALKLDPALSPAYFGLAVALRALSRPHDAIVYLERYLRREPGQAEGHHQFGLALMEAGKLDLALEHFRAALKIRPDHRDARHNVAISLLLAENFREGWPAWLQSFTKVRLPDPGTGSAPFAGKRVVVYGTEGVGDEILYASCVPELVAHAAETTLHCDRRLAPLFQRSFPAVRTLGMDKQGAQRTIGIVAPDEIHVLASFLPAYFRPDGESFPPRRSFLFADSAQAAEWRRRLDALGKGPKVGLSWRGGVDPVNRFQRSIPLSEWGPVLSVPGIHFVNLQYGDVRTEMEEARDRTGVPIHTWADANPLSDLDFFAAQIAALDLVISVGNTTVHMAGALGTPLWALLPCVPPNWKWKTVGTKTPWYPSVELFRQHQAAQWGSVMEEVRTLLSEYPNTALVTTKADRSLARVGDEV